MLATLRVEDKQIELAITSDSTLLTDAGVDDAGILVRVTGDDKNFTWKNATKAVDFVRAHGHCNRQDI